MPILYTEGCRAFTAVLQLELMKKRVHRVRRNESFGRPIDWLPIDSRLIPFLSFPHVHGVARIFLIIEMTLATLIVVGTMVVVILRSFV